MDEKKISDALHKLDVPEPDPNAKKRAVNAAVHEFHQARQKNKKNSQGFPFLSRLMGKDKQNSRRETMETKQKKKLIYGGMATAMAVVLIAGVSLTQMQSGIFETRSAGGDATMESKLIGQKSPAYVEAIQNLNQQNRERALHQQDSASPIPIEPPVARMTMSESKEELAKAAPQRRMAEADAAFAQTPAPMASSMIAPITPPDMPSPYYQEQGRDKFEEFDTNPIKLVAQEPVSTFSVDVDTASYSFMRKQINQGRMPAPNSIRVEELINYFDYDYAAPDTKDVPFKHNVTITPSPWADGKELVHIGIKGYEINDIQPKSNLVFLLDTSGSMNTPDKLPLVVNSLKMMLDTLNPDDTISVVTYAGGAGAVLEPTKVSEKSKIINALENLRARGSTAGGAGIELAYNLAEQSFNEDAVNRIILATDGDFNIGISNPDALKKLVEKKRESGIFLSVLGFGQGNYNDHIMQSLAQNGNGVAAYIDTLSEARKVLVEEATSSLFPIAKDVKIQVEFNPATVAEYRLIGYETRHLNREDFNNDKIDAGDIGAGHTVTAIYEITPVGSDAMSVVDPLRYSSQNEAEQQRMDTDFGGEYAFLKMRYKLPNEDTSKLITTPITSDLKSDGDQETKFAMAVAAFGQKLQGGKYLNNYSYDDIIALARKGKGTDEFGYRAEFINLVRLAKSLDN
ncbi:MAG: von Willebrand factor type A domain-containing protein [Alphaproteobacteria bacterium]